MSNRKLAIVTGAAFIIMTIAGGFSFGGAFPIFQNPDQLDRAKNNLLDNIDLYQNMVIGFLVIAILDLLISYTLYRFFENDNKKVSLLSAVLRVVYTIIFGVAIYYLAQNLNHSNLGNEQIVGNLNLFETIWNVGLIIFGIHILLLGYLMKLHGRIPKILWYITLVAGVSYAGVSILKLTQPESNLTGSLEMVLALPMALGELVLAIWLLVKGGKN